jgi:hypothetical protein
MSQFTEDDNDILLKLQNNDGTQVTFISGPASIFKQTEELEPIVFGLPDKEVCVVFNGELFQEMVDESVAINGAQYGRDSAAFLPTTLLLNIGLKAVNQYLEEQKNV